ncbi:MAG: hypothetical protein Q7R35_12980 [Elusimicrobiota bacterium]|nr:hypothetical protein [Elusimicrobiota bacterium]
MDINKENVDRLPEEHGPVTPLAGLKNIDLASFVAVALLGVFVVTLVTVYFYPIYPDEIQVRFWLSRLPYDFPYKISGAPACISTFFQSIPATMYVPALINWLVHGMIETAPALRVVGIFVALLWVAALTVYLNYRAEQHLICGPDSVAPARQRLYISGFVIALFSAGVFPVFLTSNRNEQLMLPSLAALAGIFILSRRLEENGRAWQKVALMAAYFISVSLVLYGHAKGLFFVPFFILVGWQVFGRAYGFPAFIAAMALLGLHVVQDYSILKASFKCPEVPAQEALFSSFSFDPVSIFYSPGRFFDQAYHSVKEFPKYVYQLGFQERTDIAYLPGLRVTPAAMAANLFIKLNFALVFFILLFRLPFNYYKRDLALKRFITANSALLALFACGLISAVFNLPKNWYDAGFAYALLLIILVFFVGENSPDVFQKTGVKRLFLYVGLAALLSQAVFIKRNLPIFLIGYAGPRVPIAKYDTKKLEADILAASRTCNIDLVHSEKLVVDDYTYLYLRKTKWPMAITYIVLANTFKAVTEFLSKSDSDGMIVNCSKWVEPYKLVVKREGDICCIPREGLKKLPASR